MGTRGIGFMVSFLVGTSAVAQHYRVIDLRPLGGRESSAFAVNDRGEVVGWAETASSEIQAVRWSLRGTIVELNLPESGSVSAAYDLNNSGQIVGAFGGHEVDFPRERYGRGLVWDGAVVGRLEYNHLSAAWAINVSRISVGAVRGNSNEFPVRWDPDDLTPEFLPLPFPHARGRAYSISDAGMIVGESFPGLCPSGEAVVWNERGEPIRLATLGGLYSAAHDINELGQIVGWASLENRVLHAFLITPQDANGDGAPDTWYVNEDRDATNELMIDLGTLGCESSWAFAINNLGEIVGASHDDRSGQSAFLWRDGVMLDLNDLLPDRSIWHLSRAHDINDDGVIVGAGSIEGQRHGYVLMPTEQPAPPVLLESTPPDSCIDPRGEIGGPDRIVLVFDRRVFRQDGRSIDPSAVEVSVTDNLMIPGIPNPPEVLAVNELPDGRSVEIEFADAVPRGEWVTINARVAGSNGGRDTVSVRVAHLPCDVNGDGRVDIRDATAFGEEFRGAQRPELIDLNRSGRVTIADATEFGRLWRGEGASTRPWNQMRLPDKPTN